MFYPLLKVGIEISNFVIQYTYIYSCYNFLMDSSF